MWFLSKFSFQLLPSGGAEDPASALRNAGAGRDWGQGAWPQPDPGPQTQTQGQYKDVIFENIYIIRPQMAL